METIHKNLLLIPVCCFLISLFSRSQCMEESAQLTLVGENHSTVHGIKYCYDEIERFISNTPQQKLNFFVEKDERRLDNAFTESRLLKVTLEGLKFMPQINELMNIHIDKLKKEEYQRLYTEIYINIIGTNEQNGLIRNRFYFLTIIQKFNSCINIIPIDGSFEEVTVHPDFEELLSKNCVFKFNYEQSLENLSSANVTEIQKIKDSIMSHRQVAAIRDKIMAEKLAQRIESSTRNIAIIGLLHVDAVKSAIENKGIKVESWNG